jgi:hydrogenase nickel incorporation protein HypB
VTPEPKTPGKVVSKNAEIAAANRELFRSNGLFVVNLIGSPGCGKTTLLEKTLPRLPLRAAVIEGDIRTTFDADRIKATGAPAVQIETQGACHLDAAMVAKAAGELDLDLDSLDVLFIENVGNLVCPAGVDLGEDAKIAIISVPEGDEKPAKYPALFVRAAVVIVNKIDLLPYVTYSLERAAADCRKLNNAVEVIALSATTGEGLEGWLQYLQDGARGRKLR